MEEDDVFLGKEDLLRRIESALDALQWAGLEARIWSEPLQATVCRGGAPSSTEATPS